MKKRTWIIGLVLMILWMMVIFYFSSQTSNEIDMKKSFILRVLVDIFEGKKFHNYPIELQNQIVSDISFYVSKTAHYLEYGILCYFSWLALNCLKKNYLRYIISLILCTLYAVSDEIHQMFSAGRTPRVQDIIIDFCGALTMVIIIEFIRTIVHYKRVKKQND